MATAEDPPPSPSHASNGLVYVFPLTKALLPSEFIPTVVIFEFIYYSALVVTAAQALAPLIDVLLFAQPFVKDGHEPEHTHTPSDSEQVDDATEIRKANTTRVEMIAIAIDDFIFMFVEYLAKVELLYNR